MANWNTRTQPNTSWSGRPPLSIYTWDSIPYTWDNVPFTWDNANESETQWTTRPII